MYPTISLDYDKCRIREKNGERLSKIMLDSDSLNYYVMFDRKSLCLEVLSEPDSPKITNTDMIILAKRWHPSTWQISQCKEIIVKKTSSVHDFGKKLSALFDIKVRHT